MSLPQLPPTNPQTPNLVEVKIDKFVHGGQGLGILPDGRKCFVWGALPSETVKVQLIKRKKDWVEGIASEIIKPSKDRILPKEPEIYLSTSPWQILDFKKEAEYKQTILAETFERENIKVHWQDFYQGEQEYGYRNKMEYNFWWCHSQKAINDTAQGKVSLALHQRGSHNKTAIKESALASEVINKAGNELIDFINSTKIQARSLKSVIIRNTKNGDVGMSLFVTDKTLTPIFANSDLLAYNLQLVYSNPKSPASVATELLYTSGSEYLNDSILNREFSYTTRSFFQVNLPVYEQALKEIASFISSSKTKNILDMYSGVGSIGLCVADKNHKLTMVETDAEASAQAQLNITNVKNQHVVIATAESALENIEQNQLLIIDPPRAGLHSKVVDRIVVVKPKTIAYLSCNPSTQARDVALLIAGGYKIAFARGYNFFPRTPHIESLIILQVHNLVQ